jgi:hypothetical protein
MESMKLYLEEKGLTATDIPKAAVVHEAMGLTYLLGAWGLCYKAQPTQRLGDMMPNVKAKLMQKGRFSDALLKAEAKVESWQWMRKTGLDNKKLVVGLAESVVMRNVLRPVTIPLKLWLTWKIIMVGKPGDEGVQAD